MTRVRDVAAGGGVTFAHWLRGAHRRRRHLSIPEADILADLTADKSS